MRDNLKITVRAATNRDCENIKNLVFGILQEYGLEPDPNGTDADIGDIETHYISRGGTFELLEDSDGNLQGTVGLYPIDAGIVELRKMYLAKSLRGRGFGKKTLQRMIEKAKDLGFSKIHLETAGVLKEAVGLYKSFGFEPTCERHTPRCDQAYTLDI